VAGSFKSGDYLKPQPDIMDWFLLCSVEMRTNGEVVVVGIILLRALLSSGQIVPPPNDNFSNRIVLAGTGLSFSGTLAGATVATNEITPPFLSSGVTQTVWWTWTPAQTSTAIIQVLTPSKDSPGNDGVAVYVLNNILALDQAVTVQSGPYRVLIG
jgi:hypothetical protein